MKNATGVVTSRKNEGRSQAASYAPSRGCVAHKVNGLRVCEMLACLVALLSPLRSY